PYGEQHYPRLGSVHGVWKNAQCTVNRLQNLVHTTLPPLKTLARFPPHRATATAPASASNVAIICPPCGFISTMCAAAASDTPAAIAATRLTNGRLVCAVRYETRYANVTRWSASRICSRDRKSTRLNSSHVKISYAVFCLKKKKHTLY